MIKSEPLCRIEAEVGPLVSLGHGKFGERRVVSIVGGTVTGDGFSGVVESGGADWQIARQDGVLEIDAHYYVRLNGQALVEIASQGYRHGPEEVLRRLALGEFVDPEEYFFRTFIRFQTGHPDFVYLNRTLAVASGMREARMVKLTVDRIL